MARRWRVFGRALACTLVVAMGCGGAPPSPSSSSPEPAEVDPPAAGLRRFHSATGAYTIDLPACDVRETAPQPQADHTLRVASCHPRGGSAIIVFHHTFDAPQPVATMLALGEERMKPYLDEAGAAIERREPIEVDGVAGEELGWHSDERRHFARVLWNERSQLTVVVLSENMQQTSRATLDSARLRITPP